MAVKVKNKIIENAVCAHCGKDPGTKKRMLNPAGSELWSGFYDQDTGELVCWGCHDIHYKKKSAPGSPFSGICYPSGLLGTTYSEFPVLVLGQKSEVRSQKSEGQEQEILKEE